MPHCSYGNLWTHSVLVPTVLCVLNIAVYCSCQAPAPAPHAAAGEYRIAGTVVSKLDGHPLNHAGVALADVKNRNNFHSIITGEDGRFQFEGLAAGKYALTGQRKGYITGSYDSHEQFSTAIVTGAGLDTEHLALRLAPAGVIAGQVLDESGVPVRHAMVTVYVEDHSSGIGQIRRINFAHTDDLGEYEIAPVLPGTYFIAVSGQPWYAIHPAAQAGQPGEAPVLVDPSLDVTYPVTYFGDGTEPENASPITIRGGEHVQADVHFNPVHALTLRFHVPEAEQQSGFRPPQLQQTGLDGSMTYVPTMGMHMVSPGIMEITGIPPGRYTVRINGEGSAAQLTGLDVTAESQELDLSSAEALSHVKISVNIPSEPETPRRGMVALRSGRRVLENVRQVDAKGEAEFEQVPPGVYDVLVFNFGKPYSVDRMTVVGANIQGHKVTIASGTSPSISLTLVTGNTQVQGVVQRAGNGVAGAMVVLVPKDPELHRDLFRRDQSDLDGTFSLPGVVPGLYTVLAIQDGWEMDWSEPRVIAAYLKHGRSVTIPSQAGRPIDLGEPIEVQSR